MRPAGECDIPPLRFLHQHLAAQRLLAARRLPARGERPGPGGSAPGHRRGCGRRSWSPPPRWTQEFDRDALGVMAAIAAAPGHVHARPDGRGDRPACWPRSGARPDGDGHGSVFDGASVVAQEWYQLGVPLGWWDTGRGPADRHPNVFGGGGRGGGVPVGYGAGAAARGEREHALVARRRRAARSRSSSLASAPTTTRGLSASTPSRMISAARSGVVRASLVSKCCATCGLVVRGRWPGRCGRWRS